MHNDVSMARFDKADCDQKAPSDLNYVRTHNGTCKKVVTKFHGCYWKGACNGRRVQSQIITVQQAEPN